MRKIILCLFALVMGACITANAQRPYTHSVGGTIGSINGFTYKAMITDHFAISTDMGMKVNYMPTNYTNLTAFTLEWNGNFMYQHNMSDNTYFFIGAGFVLGYNWKMRARIIDGYVQGWDWFIGQWGRLYPVPVSIPYGRSFDIYYDAGKGGGYGIVGFEYADKESPIAVSFDFRPGYSTFFGKTEEGNMASVGGFDWSLNFGIRYTF